MVIGLTLLFALGTPAYFNMPEHAALIRDFPVFAKLLLSNSIILAVVTGTFLNVLINHILLRFVPNK